VVGAAAVEVAMVFVLVAWSRLVSGCPEGSGACVLLVFVVVDAGVELDPLASDQAAAGTEDEAELRVVLAVEGELTPRLIARS